MKNSLYGYFIGKSLAFTVMEWFVRKTWEKYWTKIVTLVKSFIFFKFSFREGVDSVLRDGPWMIRRIPIFLNKWSPSLSLLKEELSHILVWVKFHDVPLDSYTSNGLSLTAKKFDTPMMLDSCTNFMFLESWGRSSYARVLIGINACNDFIDILVIVVHNLENTRYTKVTIRIEYEWEPPRCNTCMIFSHSPYDFPKAAPKRVERHHFKPQLKRILDVVMDQWCGKGQSKLFVGYYCSGIFSTITYADSIHAISKRFSNTAYGSFLGKKVAYHVVDNYVRNTWDNPLIQKNWHSDENLLKEDVSTVLVWVKLHGIHVTAFNEDGLSALATKLGRTIIDVISVLSMSGNLLGVRLVREDHYRCNFRVEYEWKPPRCSSCKVFGHIHEECPKNTGVGEKKTVKKPSQTSRRVPIGSKMGFKPQSEYRPIPKKSIASSSGNKKKGVESNIEVSNSNPFDVLNLVDNDVEFGTNRETTNLVNNRATSSVSSFMNVDNSSSGTTIIDKIEKFKIYLLVDKLFLWTKLHLKGNDLSHELQAICDNLDIRVRGRKKK
nr:hypothetical protein [Tanacetum cinerariifolium]